MYTVIDRRTWKVVEAARSRSELTAKGLVFNTSKPEQCAPEDLVALYKGILGRRGTRHLSPKAMTTLTEAVVDAAEELLPASAGKSTVDGPVATTRRICNSMRGKRRHEVIAECIARGVNPHTARTQYQRWFNTQKKHTLQ